MTASTSYVGETTHYSDRLTTIVCGECGIPFAVPEKWREARQADKRGFYCPNGHPRVYRETTEHKLRAELDQMKADRDYWSMRTREAGEATERERRQHSATKGQLTKTRKRAAAGLCPCCSRSFVDVRRHMANKHPEQALAGLGDGRVEVAQ